MKLIEGIKKLVKPDTNRLTAYAIIRENLSPVNGADPSQKPWKQYAFQVFWYDAKTESFSKVAMRTLMDRAAEMTGSEGVEYGIVKRDDHQYDLIARRGDSSFVVLYATDSWLAL